MTKLVSRFVRGESGATAIEYGLIAALMVGAGSLGNALNNQFSAIATTLQNSAPSN